MKTAVVIPCHNYARFLTSAIESVLAQTRKVDEIVVVDDSSDSSVAKEVLWLNMVFPQEINYFRIDAGSVWQARKSGFEESTADVLCFLDADDMLSSKYFELGLKEFTNPHVGIVYSDILKFGYELPPESQRYPESGITKDILQRVNQFHSGSLVSRKALLMSGAFNAPQPSNWSADWYLWKQVMEAGFQAAKSTALYRYRIHGESMTAKTGTVDHFTDANLEHETVVIVTPVYSDYHSTHSWMDRQNWHRNASFRIPPGNGYYIDAVKQTPFPFVFFLNPDKLPPLDIIGTMMHAMTPYTNWITHNATGSALVRRDALFAYALAKYDTMTASQQTPSTMTENS